MMRNPSSSSPPVIVGPGDGYRRQYWPECWQMWGTVWACMTGVIVFVSVALDPTFALGLIGGLVVMSLLRRRS